jgi:hypothetical protein
MMTLNIKTVSKMTFSNPLYTVQIIDIERKTSTTFLAHFLFFLAAAINSTNDTKKAGGTRH